MGEIRFEWDQRNDLANQAKHSVSFDEASTVFSDDQALLRDDPDHSNGEERFVLPGLVRGREFSWSATRTERTMK